uniref:SOCS1/2/3/CIS suppressor of cytokine signaling n=1 Tax=Phallusia mammillata TaxID=59560 RepID=A0A6F9D8V4_9ASCI|nr:SOCS1/2/3/CIS suppressor of cytokine signaling [Phallusia mammillata]
MNKKLRRILRRRKTSNTDDVTSKKQRDLPALLSARDKAEPNVYLGGDRTNNNRSLDDNEKEKGNELIVNIEPPENTQRDIEIKLEAVQPEGADRNPNISETTRANPNERNEAIVESVEAVPNTKCELHNQRPRASYTTCGIMQDNGDHKSLAFDKRTRDDNSGFEQRRDWTTTNREGECKFSNNFRDCDVEMKRTRENSTDSNESFSQRDADWGWISMSRDSPTDDCSCDHVTSHRCTMTSQRGRERWNPWRTSTCRCMTSQCRNKRHWRGCSSRVGAGHNSRTVAQGQGSIRIRTSVAVLFTIVDEDALERRPRILEFGQSWSTLPPPQPHRTAQHCQCDCCHCDVTMHSDGMDWNDYEDSSVCRHSNHCHFPVSNINSLQTQNVNEFVTSSSVPSTSSSNMAPSLGFMGNEGDVTVATQQDFQSAPTNNNNTNFCHCCCRRQSMTSQPRLFRNDFEGNFDKRLSGDVWRGNDDSPIVTTSLSHFELSKRLYARLIAYCHAKKLLSNIYSSANEDRECDFVSTIPRDENQHFGAGLHSRAGFRDSIRGDSDFISTGVSDAAQVLCHLAGVFETVEECPWYCGAMTGQEAKIRLRSTPPGTFLLRDSSDSRFLFSMSLMTRRGATSIRIVYKNGRFGFDSEESEPSKKSSKSHRHRTERTKCVIRMILHYTNALATKKQRHSIEDHHDSVANPSGGNMHSNGATRGGSASEKRQFLCYSIDRGTRKEIPIQLVRPVGGGVRSLQQISRACINKQCRLWENPSVIEDLPLPAVLKKYVRKYPYPI